MASDRWYGWSRLAIGLVSGSLILYSLMLHASSKPLVSVALTGKPGAPPASVALTTKPGAPAASAALSTTPGAPPASVAPTSKPGAPLASAALTTTPGPPLASVAPTSKPGAPLASAALTTTPGPPLASVAPTSKPGGRVVPPDFSCGAEPGWATDAPKRVALMLTGIMYRSGTKLVWHSDPDPARQLQTYNRLMEMVIKPFEAAGYEVDIFTVTYASKFGELTQRFFGDRLKIFRTMQFINGSTGQPWNIYTNMAAFANYVVDTHTWYKFLIATRHDWRFTVDMASKVLTRPRPDREFLVTENMGPVVWCYGRMQLEWEVDPNTAWAAPDFVHVVPAALIGCYLAKIYGDYPNVNRSGPYWFYECIGPWDAHLRRVNASIGFMGRVGHLDRDPAPT